MARFPKGRVGPVAIALTAYDVWRRIPPRHRRRLIAEARKHGPKLLEAAARGRRKRP